MGRSNDSAGYGRDSSDGWLLTKHTTRSTMEWLRSIPAYSLELSTVLNLMKNQWQSKKETVQTLSIQSQRNSAILQRRMD